METSYRESCPSLSVTVKSQGLSVMCSVGSWLWLLVIFVYKFQWQVSCGKKLDSRGTYSYLPDQRFWSYTTLNFNHHFFYAFHTRCTTRSTRTRSPPGRWQSILAPRTRVQSDGGNNSTRHHDTLAHYEEDPWCVRRMWVPPAQEYQGEEFAAALLTGCQQTNLCDEINPGNRHVVALKSSVPSPPVARDYELSANVGNVGKLCKRHRLPVSQARQRISPFSVHHSAATTMYFRRVLEKVKMSISAAKFW